MGGVLTVTELTARIKASLEGAFRSVRVEGEISNYKLYPSGHRYFTLKDEGAQVRVVLFRGRERFIIGETRDGQTVIVSGSLGVYEKKGEYQIYAQSVEVRGLGSLLLELEKRKVRLAAEGLFDPERKRPLPPFPPPIALVAPLLAVGGGGGSVEDLWAFNEEVVVRAIPSSSVPTISAVGHETDFTLSDLAADHRAP